MNVIEVSKKKKSKVKRVCKKKRKKKYILFIDFSSAYLSIFFTTYDLLDGIQRDYNNKAISSNWMRWAKWRGEIVFECAVFMARSYSIYFLLFLFFYSNF
jgi:ADP-heptose:LPS heptosyltransferase